MLPVEQRKDVNEMLLHIYVLLNDGDKVQVNLPVSIIKVALQTGMQMPQITKGQIHAIFRELRHVKKKFKGLTLVDVHSSDNDIVRIIL